MTLAALKYVVNKELSSHGTRGYNLDSFNKQAKKKQSSNGSVTICTLWNLI